MTNDVQRVRQKTTNDPELSNWNMMEKTQKRTNRQMTVAQESLLLQ